MAHPIIGILVTVYIEDALSPCSIRKDWVWLEIAYIVTDPSWEQLLRLQIESLGFTCLCLVAPYVTGIRIHDERSCV
jgi:hypothetical protein